MKTYEELMKENEELKQQISFYSKHKIKQLEEENERLLTKIKEPKKFITCDENGNPTYCCQKCKVSIKVGD
jgi:23S rRNA pseudoU1915 N3-methylase RlmH